jgi:hypothetical protein
LTSVPSASSGSVRRQHGAHALAGEELEQQAVVDVARDEMHPLHALAAGTHGRRQEELHVAIRHTAARKQRLRLLDGEIAQQLAALAGHAGGLHQVDELLGLERDCGRGSNILQGEVEHFAGRRITEWRKQHQLVVVEPLLHGLHVDLAHLARLQEVHAIHDADGPRSNEIAARDADVGTRHR